jgi:predicted DCC family thiol-disulfide oxidoreductase YuxK
MFAPLQSKIGQQLITEYKIDTAKVDSIILYIPEKGISYRSTAALKIASRLTYPTRLLTVFFILPAFIRDVLYDFVARRRYKWFGKKDSCMIPTPEMNDKFLQ